MKVSDVLPPKSPLQTQAQQLQKRAAELRADDKRRKAAERVTKSQQQLASANKAQADAMSKLQTSSTPPTSR
jgi:hypothetical protein